MDAVILVDANLLVYAFAESDDRHATARAWLDGSLAGTSRVALPWANLTAFVRLVTNPRIFARPASIGEAWTQVERWLGAPRAWVPLPTEEHRRHLGRALGIGGLRANDVPDAHLAALCHEHGLRLATTDRGFSRFDGLDWFDPLLPEPA